VHHQPLTPLRQAQRDFFDHLPAEPDLAVRQVGLPKAVGLVLAEDVRSTVAVPPFTRSVVEGFAVRAADTVAAAAGETVHLEVADTVKTGETPPFALRPGQAARIGPEGMLPRGADAVVGEEVTRSAGPSLVAVLETVRPGDGVVREGEDIDRGQILLERGRRLRPEDLGALAALGRAGVAVYYRPQVAVIAVGGELVPPEAEPGPGQVRDTSIVTLSACIRRDGGHSTISAVVPDDFDRLRDTIERALAVEDIVLVTAESTPGGLDLVAQVIDALGEPGVIVGGVALRPGRSTVLGLVADRPVIGLPRHPIGTRVTYELFVRPLILYRQGMRPEDAWPRRVHARLTHGLESGAGEEEFVRVRLTSTEEGLLAEPILGKSDLLSALIRAHGLAHVSPEGTRLAAGSLVEVWLIM